MSKCLICNKQSDGFTYCPECVVLCVLEGLKNDNEVMDWLKTNRPEQFKLLIDEYKLTAETEERNGEGQADVPKELFAAQRVPASGVGNV